MQLLLKLFSMDLEAVKIAELVGLHRNTLDRYLLALRIKLSEISESAAPLRGEIEIDESYFGARRARVKRGRGGS